MKNILIISTLFYCLLPNLTYAQNPETSADILNKFQNKKEENSYESYENKNTDWKNNTEKRRQNIQSRISEKRIEFQNKLEERKKNIAEKRVKLEEKSEEKINELLEKIYLKFSNLIGRLNIAADKLEVKINDLENEGVNVTKSSKLLYEARQKIDTAMSELGASKIVLENNIKNEISKEDVRTIIESMKKSINESRDALIEVVKSLKDSNIE